MSKMIIVHDNGTKEEFKNFVTFGFEEGTDQLLQITDANPTQILVAYKILRMIAEQAAEEMNIDLEEMLEALNNDSLLSCLGSYQPSQNLN